MTADVVAGVGLSSAATPGEVRELVAAALSEAGLGWGSLRFVATLAAKADDPRLVALGVPVRGFDAAALDPVAVPGSEWVRDQVGTGSVAEAAALLGAGPGASLLVSRRTSAHATVALAR